MRPYLDQTVRIEQTWIYLDVGTTYNPEHIEQMESISHLWCDRKINVWKMGIEIVAENMQLILNSPIILKCRFLSIDRAHFSFKDYKVLYNAKIIENFYCGDETDPDYWPEFIEQPGVKPLVVLYYLHHESVNTVLDRLSKSFFFADLPNAFKIVFAQNRKPLTEFRKTNETSGEKLELKKGLPTEYQNENLDGYFNYTLERSII
ncbi:hypothetical protein Ddc_24954 [Ditylenchus destructor]|nr:hypothetical protein Ddc_24954 [Ditylenchus destructor]